MKQLTKHLRSAPLRRAPGRVIVPFGEKQGAVMMKQRCRCLVLHRAHFLFVDRLTLLFVDEEQCAFTCQFARASRQCYVARIPYVREYMGVNVRVVGRGT
jgi:hypothetical protein